MLSRSAPRLTHKRIVTRGFQISAWLIGVPSFLMALFLGGTAFVMGSDHAAKPSQYLDVQTYGLVGLLANAATGLGAAFSFLNGVFVGILVLLAVSALAAALFAVMVGLVGQGLKASANWARPVAVALLSILVLIGLFALTALDPIGRFADGAVLAALSYGLWALIWRYHDHEAAGLANGPSSTDK
ncbi:hypothetical protein [Caulobacter sp. RHG1]|uniref:hypothetical protein n=1 Tax=Caulobacter sp. (strain RHG1) TaxID=2545762 RepID=UPI0015578629|nr:hypothetical protein [Caulobacter sp. RHG1]NQE60703.1 hypothetical protein [Caulobacter sp. RHG1]